MQCKKCKRLIHDQDKVLVHTIATFHDISSPNGPFSKWAIDRPTAVLNVSHLYCGDYDDEEDLSQ